MSKSNATEVIARFWIIGFLIALPIGLPAVLTGAISLGFLAMIALLVALFYNGVQWLGHRILFGGTPEYEEFRSAGKDAWFDHSAPWPFNPDAELLPSSDDEPRVRWFCNNCEAEAFDLGSPCWNCGYAQYECRNCGGPVRDEFATCDRCGDNPLG
jgi:hypothetical protein